MSERKMPSVEDYPSAANGSDKERNRPDTTAISGRVKKRSSIFRSVKDEFIAEDVPSIGEYLLRDILLPALKDLILDIGHGAIDSAFNGDGRGYSGSRRRGRDSYITYNRMYRDNRRSRRNRDYDDEDDVPRSRRRAGQIYFDEYLFETRGDAEDVLYFLCDEIQEFGDCPVSRFFDKRGETIPGNFTEDNWGWTDLSGTKIKRIRCDGELWWWIDLPRLKPI